MTYRDTRFEPRHVTPASRPVRPFDRWQWLGLIAGLAATALLLADIGGILLRWWPDPVDGSLPIAAPLIGAAVLLGYRSTGGVLGDMPAPRRRLLGLALIALGAFFLAVERVR